MQSRSLLAMPHSQSNRRARSTSLSPAIHLTTWLLSLPLIAWAIPAPAHAQNPAPAHANVASLPNIVLCMGDDHGWDETSYNQHPFLQTPNLDAMAAGGLRLDRFYAAHPTCSPTRGSVLTGRHPNRYGTFRPNYSIRPEEITIAQLLRQRGYATAHFGKWHLGPVKADSPTNPGAMGFDTWLSHDNFFELNPVLSRDGKPPATYAGESSEVLVNAATEFMESCRRQDRPYFVVI